VKLSEAIEQLKYYQSKPYVPTVKKVCNIALEAIEALQQENEQLKDENASIRNWNACEEKLYNELLESDKRRIELEEENEQLQAQAAAMRKTLNEAIDHITSGRLCSIGSLNNTYEVQISTYFVDKWRKVLAEIDKAIGGEGE
jgi:predicted nuclease with TOPRIM domain